MSTFPVNHDPTVMNVCCDDTSVTFELADARMVSAPLAWFPRLLNATPEQRANWEKIGRGYGVHWPDLDEDISVLGVLGLPD